MDESGDSYTTRAPEQTLLHRIVREQLEPFPALARESSSSACSTALSTPRLVRITN
jgi:hypothetical protein